MAKHRLDHDTFDGWNITTNGETWIVTKYGAITEFDAAGISNSGDGTKIRVDGLVAGGNGQPAIRTDGWKTHIEIGADGVLTSPGTAVYLDETEATVINRGRIYGAIYGLADGALIENYGFSTGGIILTGSGTIINHKSGIVQGNSNLRIDSEAGDRTKIINEGTIRDVAPGEYAISTEAGRDVVINRHNISGAIGLGADNDKFVSRDTKIHGSVYGDTGNDKIDVRGSAILKFGDGNGGGVFGDTGNDTLDLRGVKLFFGAYGGQNDDTYIVDSRNIKIVEGADIGNDTVKSYASFALGDNFERLTLMGNKNLDGKGNELANVLKGNSGNNDLSGLAGIDMLDGGKGNDSLRGGTEADTFIFSTGYDRDTIASFEQGVDLIDLSGWKAIKNFNAVKSHAENHGADVWITAGHDTLVISDTHKSDLHQGDFNF